MKLTALMSGMILSSSALCFSATAADKMVIAHRGASGYLPEHTLPAKAMAYAQGADYLEQDLVMTKDDRLVVLHDHYLDRVTDVAQRFPQRARKDGRFYAIDFTLDEIKSLKFTEGFEPKNGKNVQTYPGRFPMGKSDFRIHTFEEEIEFVQGLNHSTGKNIGIYPEIKAPWFHQPLPPAKSSITLPPGYLDSDYVREDGVSPVRVVTRAAHYGSLAAAEWNA